MKNILRPALWMMLILSLSMSSCTKQKKVVPAVDPNNMDLTMAPGKNFYQYANGGWMKNNPLKKEYSRYGVFDKLQEDNMDALRKLTAHLASDTSSTDPIAKKIGLFIQTGMDSAKAESVGTKPLEGEFASIAALKTKEELQAYIIQLHSEFVMPLFSLFADADCKNSRWDIAWLYQGGIGMPDRDYYTDKTPHAAEIRTSYLQYVTRLFTLSGDDSLTASQHAATVMKLETELAEASMTRLEQRDPNSIYHKMALKDLQKLVPEINWQQYFTGVGVQNPGEVNVAQPAFFKTAGKMLNTVSMDDWKVYLKWNVLDHAAPFLNNAFVQAHFNFYGKALSGKQEMQPRWKRVLNSANGALGEAIGQMYVKQYFPPEAKERMLKLVNNLRSALGERIKNLSWMGDTTKQKALEKLNAMVVKIGYPDKWRDYSKLSVTNASYIENIMQASKFGHAYMVSKINKPVDLQEWQMTPQTVNAYYNPSNNEIVFPAAILQPPFFDMQADDAVNYGAIGVVIGHEMTHGFDDQGRQFDKDGNLKAWWTDEDAKRFKERADVLVKEFSNFLVLDTVHANGQLTLGENIADLGGLNISFTAFKKTEQGHSTEKLDGFTPDQRFFLAFAHVWAQNIRNQEILRRTKEDEHSLGRFRVNGPLPNMPEFLAAFGIKPGDAMYIDPSKRASIW